MRKLTDIIKESLNSKFKYTASVKFEGYVAAENEGAAGEEADKAIDLMQHTLDTYNGGHIKMVDYTIVNLEEFKGGSTGIGENIDNNKILESLDADREGELYLIAEGLKDQIMAAALKSEYSTEEQLYIIRTVSQLINKFNPTKEKRPINPPQYSVGTEINQDLSDVLNAGMTNYDDFLQKLNAFNKKYNLFLDIIPQNYIQDLNNFNWEEGEELTPEEIKKRWHEMLIQNKN